MSRRDESAGRKIVDGIVAFRNVGGCSVKAAVAVDDDWPFCHSGAKRGSLALRR